MLKNNKVWYEIIKFGINSSFEKCLYNGICAWCNTKLNYLNYTKLIYCSTPYNCAIVETDDHIVFGVRRPDKPTNKFALLKGFRVRGEGISDDTIRNTLINVACFEPSGILWVKKSVLETNRDVLSKIAKMPSTDKKQAYMGLPAYKALSQELQRCGQEFFDLQIIRNKTQ